MSCDGCPDTTPRSNSREEREEARDGGREEGIKGVREVRWEEGGKIK